MNVVERFSPGQISHYEKKSFVTQAARQIIVFESNRQKFPWNTENKRMKSGTRFILLGGLIVAGIVGGWYWKTREDQSRAQELVLYGTVDVRQVELSFNASERIGSVLVEEGDRIKTGELLGKLELEPFELAVDRAKAQIEVQQQVVDRLVAGTRPEEIREAEASLNSAEAELKDVKATYQRVLTLSKKNVATQQDLDDARSKLETAQAKVKLEQAALDLANAGPRKEDIAEAKALLKRYKVELKQAEHDLADAHLYAPSNGIVQERILEVGDMASPQKPVYTVALIDPVWVRAYVSETDLGKISEGMQAEVVTDSFPDKKYVGWIGFISPTAEFTPKPVETPELRTKLVYQIRVFVKAPNNELRLGMPATVHIPLDQHPTKNADTRPATADTDSKHENHDH